MASLLQPDQRARFAEQFAAARRITAPMPAAERHRVSIEDVGLGGFLRFEGNLYEVKTISTYEREGARWPELAMYRLNDGTTQYLEWEKEDEVSVYVSREKLSFRQVGLKGKEHLWEISQAGSGEVRYKGARYRYHDDSRVVFFRDGGAKGTPFHQYLFSSPDKREFVGVEEWGDEDSGYEHNVILSTYLDPRAIEVIVKGGA
ncbi:MAG: DUF4178 domain-containing protein [Bryobacterales bacterium]|nr:DUF4178 domain-containing protein [Bryobacterales bacterium]MDE0627121.1 DUF4178 domain-containing protein [Bryobacterales bacterium]